MFNESHLMQQHGEIKVNIHSRQSKEWATENLWNHHHKTLSNPEPNEQMSR